VTAGPLAGTSAAPDISAPWRILGSLVPYHHTTPFRPASLPLIVRDTTAGGLPFCRSRHCAHLSQGNHYCARSAGYGFVVTFNASVIARRT
jgi:hypothetical protein